MNQFFYRYNASFNHAWYDRDNQNKVNLEKFIASLPYSLDRVIAISYNVSHRNRLYPKDMRSNFGEFNGCHQRFILFKDCIFKDRRPCTLYLSDLIGRFGFFYNNSFYGGYQFTFESVIKKSSERETDVEKVREVLYEILTYLLPYAFSDKDFMIFFDISDLYDNYKIVSNKDVFQDMYSYLVLDSAVEMCLNIVIDENGVIYDKETKHNLSKGHIYKPAPIELKYIEYLLQMGFDPYQPEYFDQYEHIEDLEDDCSHQRGVQFDLSDVKKLFDKYQ